MKVKAILDPQFIPMALLCREMREATEKDGQDIVIGIERNKGYISAYRTRVYPDGVGKDELNFEFIERMVKALLWGNAQTELKADMTDFAQAADATLSLFDLIAAQEAGETIDCGEAIAIYQAALNQQTALLKDAVTAETEAIQGITAMLG